MAGVEAMPMAKERALAGERAMAPPARTRYRAARAFYLMLFLGTCFATMALFTQAGAPSSSRHQSHAEINNISINSSSRDINAFSSSSSSTTTTTSSDKSACHLLHRSPNPCAFVLAHCPLDEPGYSLYLRLYYCQFRHLQPLALLLLTAWLGLLFTTIGIAASDFFCPNLSTISTLLGLSESIAGVTLLALGNGSPDVFSTFAAMNSHSGDLAVGELFGAAGFITAVVAGSMALIRPFRVARRSFVRDVGFFAVATGFAAAFLADGRLRLWECGAMVGFYVFYVGVVVGGSWWLRRRRRIDKEARERDVVESGCDDDGDEDQNVDNAPYHDRDDGEIEVEDVSQVGDTPPHHHHHHHHHPRPTPSRGASRDDYSALENGHLHPHHHTSANIDQDEDDEQRWMTELSDTMRLTRRPSIINTTARSRRNTLNPVRPSLVGALEFQAVVKNLQRARATTTTTMAAAVVEVTSPLLFPTRSFSDDLRGAAVGISKGKREERATLKVPLSAGPWGRGRTLSANDAAALRRHAGVRRSSRESSSSITSSAAGLPSNEQLVDLHDFPSPSLQSTHTPSSLLNIPDRMEYTQFPTSPTIEISLATPRPELPLRIDTTVSVRSSAISSASSASSLLSPFDGGHSPSTSTRMQPDNATLLPQRQREVQPQQQRLSSRSSSRDLSAHRLLLQNPENRVSPALSPRSLAPTQDLPHITFSPHRYDHHLGHRSGNESEDSSLLMVETDVERLDRVLLERRQEERELKGRAGEGSRRSNVRAAGRESEGQPNQGGGPILGPVMTSSPRSLSPSPSPSAATATAIAMGEDAETSLSPQPPFINLNSTSPPPSASHNFWPLTFLPPSGVVMSTLFPTIYCWAEKNWWEKALGLVAAPSVFLLTITLPVAELEREDVDLPDRKIEVDGVRLAAGSDVEAVSWNNGKTVGGKGELGGFDVRQGEEEDVYPGTHRHNSLATRAMPASGKAGVLLPAFSAPGTSTTEHARRDYFGTEEESHKRADTTALTSPPLQAVMDNNNLDIANNAASKRDDMNDNGIDNSPSEPWNRWLTITHLFLSPLFVLLAIYTQNPSSTSTLTSLLAPPLISLLLSILLLPVLLLTTTPTYRPRYFTPLLSLTGFLVSIAWISSIATLVVGCLKALAQILQISHAIMGLTIFAVGNSLGDLVADITLARLGYPVMALSACFGGPMLNILIGIGVSGSWILLRGGGHQHHAHAKPRSHPNFGFGVDADAGVGTWAAYSMQSYHISVSPSLIVSAVTLGVTLVGLLVAVPANGWVMGRWIGWSLIGVWTVSTIGSVVLEVGGWAEWGWDG